jgi:hypothetical protein
MRGAAFALVAVALSGAFVLADAQQIELPKDGNGLLDYCSHVVSLLDAPSTQKTQDDAVKAGWCAGYVEATEDRVEVWRIGAAIQVMAAVNAGQPAPAHMHADEDFAATCFPDGAPVAQLARVLVKWLRDHPEKLHEPKSLLVMEAFRDAFPCQSAKEANKPSPKPQP